MDKWRQVWRGGFAPSLTVNELLALKRGLELDSPELVQGCTTQPPPIAALSSLPCEAGCGISYAAWKGNNLTSVGEVEEYFAQLCFLADEATNDAGSCRHFLNAFDDTPRSKMFAELLSEVNLEISKRGVINESV